MATMRDVITGAYARLGLLPLGQNLDPDRAAAGLAALNDLFASWTAQGVAIGIPSSLQLSDDFPLDPQHLQGVKAMLAVQLASNSGIEALASVQREAKRSWDAILAQYVTAPNADRDDGLTWLPSLRRYGFR